VLYYLASILCMHACCGFFLSQHYNVAFLILAGWRPQSTSHAGHNFPACLTAWTIYQKMQPDTYTLFSTVTRFASQKEKKKKKLFSMSSFKLYIFFLSAQHNTKFESHRVAYSPTEFGCKKLQRISPAASSSHKILVRACLHLITIHSHDLQISTFKEENWRNNKINK
jgi:hypothetical protein